jgi:hypothetical protein
MAMAEMESPETSSPVIMKSMAETPMSIFDVHVQAPMVEGVSRSVRV